MAQQHSMLDFGPIMQLAQLTMGMERMDLARQQEERQAQHQQIQQAQFEERQALEQQQHVLNQQRLRKDQADTAFKELEKLKMDPSLALNRERQIDITQAQVAAMEHGLGVKIPMPDRDEMRGGYEAVDKFVKTLQDPNATSEQKFSASSDLFAANPTYGLKVLDEMKKAGDVSFQMEELHAKLAKDKAQFDSLNRKTAQMKLQENFFTEHSGAVGRIVSLPTDKNWAEDYRKIISFQGDTEKAAKDGFLQEHPILKTKFESVLKQERPAVEQIVSQLEQTIDARGAAIREYEGRGQTVPQELVDETAALEAAYKARRTELDFIDDPYNKDKYKALQKMHQDLRIRQSAAGKQIGEIVNERTALMRDRFDAKQQATSDLAKAQVEFGGLPTEQQTPQNAARIAGKFTGVLPKDVLEAVKDPNRPGVSVTMTQEKAEAAGVGKDYAEQFSAMEKASFASVSKIAKYDRMQSLLDQVNTGKLQPTKQRIQEMADALGFKVDPSLPAAQALESLTNEMTLELRNPSGGAGMPGAMSDKDREFLSAMSPGLARTKEGNELIIETGKKLAQRNMEVAKMARAYRKKNGQFDGGFYDELAEWSEKHPLFDSKKLPKETTAKAAAAATSATPAETAAPITITGEDDHKKLPSGTIYLDPNGVKRRKK